MRARRKEKGGILWSMVVAAMHLGWSLGKPNTLTMQHGRNIGETFPHGGSVTLIVFLKERGGVTETSQSVSSGGLSRASQPLLRC